MHYETAMLLFCDRTMIPQSAKAFLYTISYNFKGQI
jgi:hypothetical protein